VTLNVTPTATLSVSSSNLTFTQNTSGTPPPAQTVNVTSAGGTITFNATATVNQGVAGWLSVTPTTATTSGANPAVLSLAVNGAGLLVGTYTGQILLSSPGAQNSQVINVTLSITNAASIIVNPTVLQAVNFQLTSPNPAAQNIALSTSNAAPLNFTAQANMTTG